MPRIVDALIEQRADLMIPVEWSAQRRGHGRNHACN